MTSGYLLRLGLGRGNTDPSQLTPQTWGTPVPDPPDPRTSGPSHPSFHFIQETQALRSEGWASKSDTTTYQLSDGGKFLYLLRVIFLICQKGEGVHWNSRRMKRKEMACVQAGSEPGTQADAP